MSAISYKVIRVGFVGKTFKPRLEGDDEVSYVGIYKKVPSTKQPVQSPKGRKHLK